MWTVTRQARRTSPKYPTPGVAILNSPLWDSPSTVVGRSHSGILQPLRIIVGMATTAMSTKNVGMMTTKTAMLMMMMRMMMKRD